MKKLCAPTARFTEISLIDYHTTQSELSPRFFLFFMQKKLTKSVRILWYLFFFQFRFHLPHFIMMPPPFQTSQIVLMKVNDNILKLECCSPHLFVIIFSRVGSRWQQILKFHTWFEPQGVYSMRIACKGVSVWKWHPIHWRCLWSNIPFQSMST